ncbi:MAG: hypothetical protein CSA39_06070 [Flavobacteriales bacterium]|nr:MAG: hypothetical protein CSA39_06070 [Flavobacteriales bacterium]
MQFKHPELLYALFSLLIPIFIHLFQLRRFKKTPFTNVKFLKKVTLQTRKSSRIKKILVLCVRLLLFAAIIFAFAQPFLTASSVDKPDETFIYLDNSMSMQAKGNRGELLKRSVQELIENMPADGKVNLITNDNVYNNLSYNGLKNTLLSLDYTTERADLNLKLLQIESQLKKRGNAAEIYFISDFQEVNFTDSLSFQEKNRYYFIQLAPKIQSNFTVDSLYISDTSNDQLQLTALISNSGNTEAEIPVTLFNNNMLSGKSSVNLSEGERKNIDFKIPIHSVSNGYVSVEDVNMPFDNILYFSIDKPQMIPVAVIGKDYDYLSKIYTENEFLLQSGSVREFDYNAIARQQVVILNELDKIPEYLLAILQNYVSDGGNVVIVPSAESNLTDYNALFSKFGLGQLTTKVENPLAITGINYQHPLLRGVFEKEVQNFQYPEVKFYFKGNLQNTTTVLYFQDNQPFLSAKKYKNGHVYVFLTSLNRENSNFKNSPLVVPVFYNFGLFSFKNVPLYYINGMENHLDVEGNFSGDKVLKLKDNREEYIPLQQIFADKAAITFGQLPFKSGILEVVQQDSVLKKIALNYSRVESALKIKSPEDFLPKTQNIKYSNSIQKMFTLAKNTYKETELWKYFVILSLMAVLAEILLLKYLKG